MEGEPSSVVMAMGLWGDWMPVLAMLAVDVVFAAMNLLIKTVIDGGLDRLVLITLRQLVATLFMAPIAFFRERKTRPKLTFEICVYLFFTGLLGASLTQYLFFVGLQYTSATFACAFLNMTPVITFLIALPFGLETVDLKSKAGIAKVFGTVVCLTGALVLTLYKGVALTNTSSHQLATVEQQGGHMNAGNNNRKWMIGSITLVAGSICWSGWFLLQSRVGKKFPAIYTSTALIFFLSFLQAAGLCLATQRGISLWVLRERMVTLTVLFAGIVGSGVGFLAMSWCVKKRGPVFTAAFTPLVQIMVAVFDTSVLHETLHLGSVLGSFLVIVGLYFLLWGKNMEARICAIQPAQENNDSPYQLKQLEQV